MAALSRVQRFVLSRRPRWDVRSRRPQLVFKSPFPVGPLVESSRAVALNLRAELNRRVLPATFPFRGGMLTLRLAQISALVSSRRKLRRKLVQFEMALRAITLRLPGLPRRVTIREVATLDSRACWLKHSAGIARAG